MKLVLLFILLFSISAFSQQDNKIPRFEKINWRGEGIDLKMNSIKKKMVIPSILMISGLSLNTIPTKTKLQDFIREPFNGYSTNLDDFIQYAPIVMMYSSDLFKIPARNSIWNQTKYLFISELVTGTIVQVLKHTTKIARPNSNTLTAFPSGHTAQAFVAGQVLFHEFYRTRPLLGLSGFIFASSTGALRVVNNRHWVPDVLMGAGIAIFVTNLVYHFEPFKNWDPFTKFEKDLSLFVSPVIQNDNYGLKMNLAF
ncbi:MAG: phosphatase PAP2 family protein [Crocinitomicaceae bacterium]